MSARRQPDTSRETRLVVFDIDGTLLRCGPQIRPLFGDALAAVYGELEPIGRYNFAGKTDPRIVLDLLGRNGRPEDEIRALLPEMQRVYFANLQDGLDVSRMELLPAVVETLERFVARDDLSVGLLTGNWRRGAEIKLSRFDLGRFFTFGAFGDDAVDRRDLVPVALARAAAATGRTFTPATTLVIGDSELDVDCARAAGAASLAVATGYTTKERLRAAGADWVFDDLAATARELELFRT